MPGDTSKLVQDILGDSSDSETDLDLPDPITFLQPVVSSPAKSTPPPPAAVGTAAAEEGKPKPVTTTYSPKRTPRSKRSSHRNMPSSPGMKDTGASNSSSSRKTPERQAKKQFRAIAENQISLLADESTRSKNKSRNNKKKKDAEDNEDEEPQIVIQTTGLTAAQLKRIQSAATAMSALMIDGRKCTVTVYSDTSLLRRALVLQRQNGFTARCCTHLVAPADKHGRTARTFKYLVGLACGAHAVVPEWLTNCVKAQRLVPESDYSIKGDTAMPNHSISERPHGVGQLLKGFRVHLWGGDAKWGGPSSAHTAGELKALIAILGAHVVDELEEAGGSTSDSDGADTSADEGGDRVVSPRLRRRSAAAASAAADLVAILPKKYRRLFERPIGKDATIVLVDPDDLYAANRPALRSIARATGGAVPCRAKSWLFDCISANKLL
ncbi:hypothetical protein GGI23_002046 [Coemansia sp. RSA 2559]|nr:hypothetical protein GGI23_002046 [Coemansia sp. RSA 2559]KAJ2864436.1 hypothetical protein GGI22_001725 [Coemansia erecta]